MRHHLSIAESALLYWWHPLQHPLQHTTPPTSVLPNRAVLFAGL